MGCQDPEYPNPLQLFAPGYDPWAHEQSRIRKRLSQTNGRPLVRIGQVNDFYADLMEEPMLRLEFDRFGSRLSGVLRADG